MRIDLKKGRKDLYRPGTAEFVEVDVPETTYLAVDGRGDPNISSDYLAAVQALFTGGYSVRAAFKQRTGDDFVVGPLEGLWSSDDPSTFASGTKDAWDWTMLIPLPDPVERDDIDQGLATAATKKPKLPWAKLHPLTLTEGRCLQILHLGSYDDEAPTLARLHHELMPARGLTWNGRHHEIYLSDPRRVAADKLKTVLRQPVREID